MNEPLPESLPDCRFPAAVRLKGGTALYDTFRRGKRISSGSVGLTYKTSELSHFGIGVTKGFGNAVRRNRMKRVIREYLRQNKGNWPSGHDVFIRVFSNSQNEKQVIAELCQLLTRIK
jgi:ribonuclease P protein component